MAIVLYCGGGGDLRLLPTCLEHYRKASVDAILFTLHVRHHDPALERWVRAVLRRFDATLASIWHDPSLGHGRRIQERTRTISSFAHPDDWIVNVDLDEFHEYPVPLAEMVEACERRGHAYVMGAIIDRITPDGAFPELDIGRLWEQFPVKARLTRNILGGDDQKVALSRAGVPLTPGYHRVAPGADRFVASDYRVSIQHFKWDGTVLRRLADRILDLQRDGRNWWDESAAFLAWVERNGGRLDLSDPALGIDCM